MTKEELKKEAEEYADWFWGASPSMMKALARAYIKGAEPREKRIAELEAQIECCAKCSHCNTYITSCIPQKRFVKLEEVCEDFELKEIKEK